MLIKILGQPEEILAFVPPYVGYSGLCTTIHVLILDICLWVYGDRCTSLSQLLHALAVAYLCATHWRARTYAF